MAGAAFVFSRRIGAETRGSKNQVITVYAEDIATARRVLRGELKLLREGSDHPEAAFSDEPAWEVDQITLDKPRVVTSLVTT